MEIFFHYFLLFFIYSVLGWITETTYASIKQKKLVDRGFLIGPYCPIYGFGAIIGILYLTQYKNNILTVFILAAIIACITEYITSYIMEKIFKARWWDYSNEKFNINGRICGKNAMLFGICGIAVIYIIQPTINFLIKNINNKILMIISIVLFIIFMIDTILSYNIIKKLKNNLKRIEIKKDSTKEIKVLVLEKLTTNINGKIHKNILQKRLIKAYPNLDLKKIIKFQNPKYKKLKELFKIK